MRSAVVCLLLGTACADPPPPDEEVVTLADFPVNSIKFTVTHELVAELRYPWPGDRCLVLADDVIAKSGDALFVIEPGAISYRFDGFAECTNPIASLDVLPQLSSATFEIQDSTRKIVCNLDSALVARTASLVPDGPWVGAPGQKLTVRWPSQQELFTREMTVKIGDEELGILYHDYPDYDLMSFTVPLLPAGTYPLVIKRLNRPRDATCDDREIDGFISEEPDELRTFSVDLEII